MEKSELASKNLIHRVNSVMAFFEDRLGRDRMAYMLALFGSALYVWMTLIVKHVHTIDWSVHLFYRGFICAIVNYTLGTALGKPLNIYNNVDFLAVFQRLILTV